MIIGPWEKAAAPAEPIRGGLPVLRSLRQPCPEPPVSRRAALRQAEAEAYAGLLRAGIEAPDLALVARLVAAALPVARAREDQG
ncbi:MAG: hypothetical protein EON47_17710 [Acetobacteraceae bacterium]|nr:MAG: hypothetical protein EON47_17710 [Acetobacteraceae bacterium]